MSRFFTFVEMNSTRQSNCKINICCILQNINYRFYCLFSHQMITINYLNLEGGIIVFFPRGYNSEDGDLHPPQIAYNKP